MSIFSKVNKSERIDGVCCICNLKIDYLYKPSNQKEYLELHNYSDIESVYICKKCDSLRHFSCSIKRREDMRSRNSTNIMRPTFGEALKSAVEGGDKENKIFLSVLEKETDGLECPICSSFETLSAFMKNDGSIIKIKSGKRID